ncbi:MAG: ATPase domain-containing protein [Gemmatimonadota bacterium]
MKIHAPNAQALTMLMGIQGFDEITDRGLPRGRTTLVMGGPGCGQTVFARQSLVNGAQADAEAGIFVAFEESTRQIVDNAATFGWDLPARFLPPAPPPKPGVRIDNGPID